MNKSGDIDWVARYGPWALIAGASEGIGAEYTRQLAQRGLNLILVARSEQKLRDLAKQLGEAYSIQTQVIVADLAEEQSAQRVFNQVENLSVGLLVCNAAYAPVAPFFDLSLEDRLRELDTNCRTPLSLVYLFGKRMLSHKRGGIILMSSLSSAQGSAYIANYVATKAYNQMLAEGLWAELRSQGIDVLEVSPSSVSTPGFNQSLPEDNHQVVKPSTPQEVVSAALSALGKGPGVIPGWGNQIASFIMRRFFPRKAAVQMLSRVLKNMYSL